MSCSVVNKIIIKGEKKLEKETVVSRSPRASVWKRQFFALLFFTEDDHFSAISRLDKTKKNEFREERWLRFFYAHHSPTNYFYYDYDDYDVDDDETKSILVWTPRYFMNRIRIPRIHIYIYIYILCYWYMKIYINKWITKSLVKAETILKQ